MDYYFQHVYITLPSIRELVYLSLESNITCDMCKATLPGVSSYNIDRGSQRTLKVLKQ